MDLPPRIPSPSASPNPEPNPDANAVPQMSLLARLLNIFSIPGAVFEDVRASAPSLGSWIVPILIASFITALTFSSTLAQPGVLEKLREQQKERFAGMVESGKIQQAEAEQNARVIEWMTQPSVARFFFGITAILVSCVRVFWWGFAVWFVGRSFLRYRFSFLKGLEIAGLASMISVLGSVVVALLSLGSGSAAAAGEVAVTSPDTAGRPIVPIAASLFNIWFVTLLAAGLARLAGVRLSRTLLPMMGVWLVSQMVLALVAGALTGLGS